MTVARDALQMLVEAFFEVAVQTIEGRRFHLIIIPILRLGKAFMDINLILNCHDIMPSFMRECSNILKLIKHI